MMQQILHDLAHTNSPLLSLASFSHLGLQSYRITLSSSDMGPCFLIPKPWHIQFLGHFWLAPFHPQEYNLKSHFLLKASLTPYNWVNHSPLVLPFFCTSQHSTFQLVVPFYLSVPLSGYKFHEASILINKYLLNKC